MRILHKDFITFAEENGINLNDSDDYKDWYNCWMDGYDKGLSEESYEPWVVLSGGGRTSR